MNTEAIERKVEEYQTFLEEKLRKDLKDIETVLNDRVKEYSDWEDVKKVASTVKSFKEKDRDMKVQFDLGCGVRAVGEITDFERTYICIGLGYMLEMDCEEASKYSDIRLRLLKKEIDHFRKLAVDVKVNIKMVLLAINELQSSLLPDKLKRPL